MDIVLAYLAGVLTLINPCVLPVLPITLASAMQSDRRGPLVLAAGMSLVFVVLGVGLSALGPSVGLNAMQMANIGAVMMVGFGLILLVPQFSHRFSAVTSGFASGADQQINEIDDKGLKGQFLGGMLLGAVWSPCVGPTLGGAISLASQNTQILWATAIMTAYALGISTIILALAYGAREVIAKRQATLRALAEKSKPIMGIVFVLVGLMIFFDIQRYIEGWLLDLMPYWLQDLSVIF